MKIIKLISMIIMTAVFSLLANDASAKLLPTNLKITVLDELGNPVEGANVMIYLTEDNYLNSTEALSTMVTNKKGIVKFKKLSPKVYFIEAIKGDLKNDGLGAATDKLAEGRTNTVNVVIE